MFGISLKVSFVQTGNSRLVY
uniref:Uncharacterized protein n=1 Tax=Arundo donax TaxID=35708 RepID=A0A0A9BF99_ARUDO